MNNDDLPLMLIWLLIFVTISFVIGFVIGTPNYQFSENVRAKLQQDAINNYRSDHEQIRFIIDTYYKDTNKQNEE